MEVIFLGYRDLDFDTEDGKHIDGIKFFYFSDTPSKSNNFYGFEPIGFFIQRVNPLSAVIAKLQPGCRVLLDWQFNGKRAELVNVVSV